MVGKKKLSLGPKFVILILGLILITLFIDHFMRKSVELRLKWTKNDNIKEGFDIGDAFGQLFDVAGNTMNSVFTSLAMLSTLFTGFPNLGIGINNHFNCGKTQSNDGYKTGLDVLGVILKCSWEKFINFWNGKCTIYYICDMIYGILFGLCIELPIIIIYAITGLDLMPLVGIVYDLVILPVDIMVFSLTGYHITEWPNSIINKCYRCKGTIVANGQSTTITETLGWWASIFNCTNTEIADGADKIFKSIIPNPYWNTWFEGNNLSGDDWNQ